METINWKSWSANQALEEAGTRGWITREGEIIRMSPSLVDEMVRRLESDGVPPGMVTEAAQSWLDLNVPLLDAQSEADCRLAFGMTLLASGGEVVE